MRKMLRKATIICALLLALTLTFSACDTSMIGQKPTEAPTGDVAELFTGETYPSDEKVTDVTAEDSHVHSFGEWVVATEPTCMDAGLEERYCSCGAEEFREIAATGHILRNNVCEGCGLVASQGMKYISNGDGTCYVSEIGSCTDTDIMIPNTHNGDTVTAIGKNAFSRCKILASITIPDSVTEIGLSAFSNCTGLASIDIPDSVAGIGDEVFKGCTSLTSITFGEKSQLTSIGGSAFRDCSSLKSITIPEGVTEIGNEVFGGCTSLTSTTFGENSQLISIGGFAFGDCSNLASITIPDSVTSIGYAAFRNCSSLTSITIPDSLTSIDGDAFQGCENLTSITIPDSVTSIGDYAFNGCSGLKSITVPDSVTSIGDYAFNGCSGLKSITIPDGVTSIGSSAFEDCSSLESITLPFVGNTKGGTENTHFGYIFGAPSYSENSKYVPASLTTVVITGGTDIDTRAFYNCRSLTSITIPNSLTDIGAYAFSGYGSLTSITFDGTKAQWEAIKKGPNWNENAPDYVIHCTDGDVAK